MQACANPRCAATCVAPCAHAAEVTESTPSGDDISGAKEPNHDRRDPREASALTPTPAATQRGFPLVLTDVDAIASSTTDPSSGVAVANDTAIDMFVENSFMLQGNPLSEPDSEVEIALPHPALPSPFEPIPLKDSRRSTMLVPGPAGWGLEPLEIVTDQPGPSGTSGREGSVLGRKLSKRRKGSVSNKSTFFDNDYIEIFTIGGGTKWLYATIELLLEIFVLLKHFGFPMAGQIVDAYKACMDTPYFGALLKFIMGAATRVSFSVAGAVASDHPALDEVSVPSHV